jgi:hypothetical protein
MNEPIKTNKNMRIAITSINLSLSLNLNGFILLDIYLEITRLQDYKITRLRDYEITRLQAPQYFEVIL